MIFSTNNFKEEFVKQLTDAMCFVFENDAEVVIQSVEETRKVLSTTIAVFSGEFVSGELYGKFRGSYAAKGEETTVERIYITICDSPAESTIQFANTQDLMRSLMTAHKLFFTRENLAPRQYEIIATECENLAELAKYLPDNRMEAFKKSLSLIRAQIMIDFDVNKATDKERLG